MKSNLIPNPELKMGDDEDILNQLKDLLLKTNVNKKHVKSFKSILTKLKAKELCLLAQFKTTTWSRFVNPGFGSLLSVSNKAQYTLLDLAIFVAVKRNHCEFLNELLAYTAKNGIDINCNHCIRDC